MPDIRDIVPPDPVVDGTLSVVALVSTAVLVIALLVLGIVWLTQRLRGPRPPVDPAGAVSEARRRLEALRSESDQLAPAEILDRLADTTDLYLHRRFGIPARFRTADELTREHAGYPPPVPEVAPFAELLRSLDEERFTGPSRSRDRATALVDSALSLIN